MIKEAGNKTKVSSTKSAFFYHTIQSHIILDDYPGLVSTLVSWLKDGEADDHLLRLMAHLVLVHRGLGLGSSMKDEEMILVEYTRYLMKEDRLPIIPWYVSRLSSEIQLPLYSRFLAGMLLNTRFGVYQLSNNYLFLTKFLTISSLQTLGGS